MDYQLESKDKSKSITAKKFWAAADQQVVCLIAGLEGSGTPTAYTTLDQCRWRGPVMVNEENNTLEEGVHELNKVSWIQHAGFAYIPIGPTKIDLHLATATGSWKEINASETNTLVTEKVFMPVMQHEVIENGTAGYVMVACKSPKEAAKMAASPRWKVLRNDREVQSVLFDDGTLMAAFYHAGRLQLPNKKQVSVDQPCLIMVIKGDIWLSSPSGSSITVTLDVYSQRHKVILPADGSSVKI
jgi:hypothetical protein